MTMKKTLFTMAAVAMMCAMVFSGCNSPDSKTTVNPVPLPLTLKGSVQGLVVDVRNDPVADAVVTLLYPGAPDDGAVTNAAGQYLFENVPVAGELFWDPTSPADAQYGNGSPYLITVEKPGYATTYTAVLLDYASLAAQGQIELIGGQLQAVGNLQSTAITARVPTETARVRARVKNFETSQMLADVLCSLSLQSSFVPNAELIWANGQGTSVHAFRNNAVTSDSSGVCEWLAVPEATDADTVLYTLTLSLPGFVAAIGQDMDVEVGYGGTHWYHMDSDPGDYDPWTPYAMVPYQLPIDDEAPFVVWTNIPSGGEIAFANRGENLVVRFNERMDPVAGQVRIDAASFKTPGPVPLVQSWNAEGTELTIDPVDLLPEGMNLEISLENFRDLAQNAYAGLNPIGAQDALTRNSGVCTVLGPVCVTVTTSGNPTLTQAQNLAQVLRPADVNVGPFGGAANRIPQANNVNQLDWQDLLGLCGGPSCGLVPDETDTIFLAWDAATPAPPAGLTRQYELYAELMTGGIPGGLPVKVGETPKSSDPVTNWAVSLGAINAELAAVVPPIPTIAAENDGGVLFFDNGFGLQMAVIAVNSNNVRGPFSNAVSVQDNVPPTVADQSWGWDADAADYPGLDPFGLAPVDGSDETNLPIYLLTSGWGVAFDVNLQALAERTDGAGSTTYNAADWTWFSGQGTTIDVIMSEDLDTAQDPLPALTLDTASAASIDSASIPGTTDSRRDIRVNLSGAVLLAPGDTLAFANAAAAIIDEAGNPANAADATLVFADAVAPLFTNARVEAATGDRQQLVATFSEPVATTGAGDAELVANYILPPISAPDTVTLSGQTVTILSDDAVPFKYAGIHEGWECPPAGISLPGTNELAATVEDLHGNVTGGGLVAFLVEDNIRPRITDLLDPLAANVEVNTGASVWTTGAVGAPTLIQVVAVTSEPVVYDANCDGVIDVDDANLLGISATMIQVNAGTYFPVANADPVNIGGVWYPVFESFILAGETVEENDGIRFNTMNDIAGNALSTDTNRARLRVAGDGVLID